MALEAHRYGYPCVYPAMDFCMRRYLLASALGPISRARMETSGTSTVTARQTLSEALCGACRGWAPSEPRGTSDLVAERNIATNEDSQVPSQLLSRGGNASEGEGRIFRA